MEGPRTSTEMEMPKYRCHKVVHALKIAKIVPGTGPSPALEGDTMFIPAEENFAAIKLSRSFIDKHDPQVGGYYVVYEDGYLSYSPAKAFNDGYVRIHT